MRFYKDFPEALNELKRELKEMGIRLKTKSVQNIDISKNSNYEMLEVQNYTYLVTSPELHSIPLNNVEWCMAEFSERTSGIPWNPGEAWKLRENYWKTFMREDGTQDYSYPERMAETLPQVIDLLKTDLNTRRAFLAIFDPIKDDVSQLSSRVPCSLGYWFYYRQGKLNVTYLQRSADFSEHFNNDIYLAYRLCEYVAEKLKVEPGTFSHWLGSLHIFAKDVQEVF